jgi:hypothetical protein
MLLEIRLKLQEILCYKLQFYTGLTTSCVDDTGVLLQLVIIMCTFLFLSVEAVEVCIQIENMKVLLAVLYTSPSLAWSEADVTELLIFRHKSLVAGDLDVKYPLENSAASNASGEKLLELIDINSFDISASQYSTHFFL